MGQVDQTVSDEMLAQMDAMMNLQVIFGEIPKMGQGNESCETTLDEVNIMMIMAPAGSGSPTVFFLVPFFNSCCRDLFVSIFVP